MDGIILMCKRNASITVAGLALGTLLLAGSPAGAQTVYAPAVDQQEVYQQQQIQQESDSGAVTPGENRYQNHNGWSGHTNPGWGGNTNDPRFDRREAYQQQRIQQGIDSGALTRGETRYLEREQGRIDRAEERMAADGNLSPRERQRLNQMQNQASRDIYRLENNHRTAGWGGNNYNGWSGHTNSGWGGNNYSGWGGNTDDPRFDRREAYQQQRIQQGIADGSLTRGEARYLEREQGRIDRAEERMAADGNLSPRERQRLNQMQNQASRDIYRLENNRRTADGYNGNQAGWQGHNRGWDGRDYGWHGNNPVGAGHTPGENGYNHGWQNNGNSGWHGNNPVGAGHTPDGTTTNGTTTAGYNQGQGNRGSGWQGHNSGGGTTTTGTTTTAGNTRGQGDSGSGWQGNKSGGSGYTTGGTTTGGTTTAGTQGGQRNYTRTGQPGAYQQPAAQAGARSGQPAVWQGQQQYQRPSMQQAQPQMRPGQPAPWQGQQYQQARMQAPQTQFNMMGRQPSGAGGMVNRASFSGFGGARRR